MKVTDQDKKETAYIAQGVVVAKTGKHMTIPISVVQRARDHLHHCVCIGSSKEACEDLDAFLNEL